VLRLDPNDPYKQELYALYTRQLPIDLALCALLVLLSSLAGAFREHPAAAWLHDNSIVITLVSGLYLIKQSYYHLAAFMLTFAGVFCGYRYWNGGCELVTIPLALLLGLFATIVVVIIRHWLFGSLERWKDTLQLLAVAIRHNRGAALLQEWFPPRAVAATIALAGLPTLFLYGMAYKAPPYLLFIMASAPLLFRWAGVISFEKAFVACFKLAAWTALPLLLVILYLFALYRAWRQYKLANEDD